MTIARKLMLVLLLNLCAFAQAQVQKYDLSNIHTIKEAETYYKSCMGIPFRDNVSSDDVYEMLHKLFALSQRLCMRSIDDVNDIDNYHCEINASNWEEEINLNHLRMVVSENYLSVQQLLDPYGKPISTYKWTNFTNYYSGLYKRISEASAQKIFWFEAELNGIKFVEFHNIDENFAYDIKVYYPLSNKKTLVREQTLLPKQMKVISSNVDVSNNYFSNSFFVEIVNKYYVGGK